MRKFGIEIEAIGATKENVARAIRRIGIECYSSSRFSSCLTWKVVSDGSIGSSLGFELVSPPLSLNEDGFNEVKKVLRTLNDTFDIKIRKTCGLHVHIDVTDLSPQHIANIVKRYKAYETKIDKFIVPSRRRNVNSYCKSLSQIRNRNISERSEINDLVESRYYKVNTKAYIKYGTLEFRHHGSTTNFKKISSWIKFLDQFITASTPRRNEDYATSVVNGIVVTGKSQKILRQLQVRARTAQELAETLNSTVKSIQSMICIMKRNGINFIKEGRKYALATTSRVDSLWSGIDNELKNFFAARAEVLA